MSHFLIADHCSLQRGFAYIGAGFERLNRIRFRDLEIHMGSAIPEIIMLISLYVLRIHLDVKRCFQDLNITIV